MCIGASPAGVRRAHRVNSVNSDTDSLWDSRRRIPTGLEALPEGELHLRLVPPPVVTRGRVQQTAQHPCPRKSILTLRGWPGQAGGPSSRRGGARICRTSSLLGGSSCGPCRRFCRPGWHGGTGGASASRSAGRLMHGGLWHLLARGRSGPCSSPGGGARLRAGTRGGRE